MKNPKSNRIADVGSQGRSMTWGESLQCRIVQVGVSQCPTGGWRKRQGTVIYVCCFGKRAHLCLLAYAEVRLAAGGETWSTLW
jgi:hypothetical protein